jgi:teichuronic acid exporter
MGYLAMTLKQKTVSGLVWSFIDNFSRQGITFIIGIILARLLSPREFGLIGMTTIFLAISQAISESGFTTALIRKKNCTQVDYSTVFYFNIVIGFGLYAILFLSAGSIGRFFNEPQLYLILQILGISIILNALSIVQRARLIKLVNFKLQAKISVVSSTASGLIGIALALSGWGIWSLVARITLDSTFTTILLWIWNAWRPSIVFSQNTFKEMFNFGYKLLISTMIDTLYKNIYLLIIGKYYSAIDLGYYTRANQFKNLASQSIGSVIQRVSFPILAEIRDDIPQLKSAYRRLIKSTALITFAIMMLLAASSESLILNLIGEKWSDSIFYLQLLCFVGMFIPIQALNLNMLNVVGRSDLFLKLEIIKKIIAIPAIVLGVMYGIDIMIYGMIVNILIFQFINSYYSGKYIGYSSLEQLRDISPAFILAIFVGLTMYSVGLVMPPENWLTLLVMIFLGCFLIIIIPEVSQMRDYLYLKDIIIMKYKE